MSTRIAVRQFFSILALTLFSGCAATTTSLRLGPADSDLIAERRALGSVDDVAAAEEGIVARLRAIARVEEALGNEEMALATSQRAVARARTLLAFARGHGVGISDAREVYVDEVKAHVALARPHSRWWEVAHVLSPKDARGIDDESLLDAIRHGATIESEDAPAVETLAGVDDDVRLSLDRHDGVSRLTPAALARTGLQAVRELAWRLDDAVEHGRVDEARALATEWARVDPWAFAPRAARAYFADRAARRVPDDTRLFRAAVGSAGDGPLADAATLQRANARAAAPSLRLALALLALEQGLYGDARALGAELVAGSAGDSDIRETAAGIAAVAGLAIDDVENYTRWCAAAGCARSIERTYDEARAPGTRSRSRISIARRARVRVLTQFAEYARELDHGPLRELAADLDAPMPLRRRAIEVVRTSWGQLADTLETCVADRILTARCTERTDALSRFVEADDDLANLAPVDELFGRTAPLPNAVFEALAASDHVELARLGPWLESYRGTRVAVTPAWVAASVWSAIAEGDAERAAQLLAQRAGVLAPSAHLVLRLAIDDLRARVATPQELLAASPRRTGASPVYLTVPQAPARGAEASPTANTVAGTTRGNLATLGGALAGLHAPRVVLPALEQVARAVSGGDAAVAWAYVALAAAAAGESRTASRAAAEAERAAPGSSGALVARAHVARIVGDAATAEQSCERAVIAEPFSTPLWECWIDGVAGAHLDADGARRVDMVLGVLASKDADALRGAREGGLLHTGADVRALRQALARDDESIAAIARFGRITAVAQRAMSAYVRRVDDAADAGKAVAAARDAARAVASLPPSPQTRAGLAWLLMLAGDVTGATRVAAQPADAAKVGSEQRLPTPTAAALRTESWEPISALAQLYAVIAARAALDDASAWQAYRKDGLVSSDASNAATLTRLLAAPAVDASVRALACRSYAAGGDAAAALDSCGAARRARTSDRWAMLDLMWAVARAPNEAAEAGLAMDELHAEFTPRSRLESRWSATYKGRWLTAVGRVREAAETLALAWADGAEAGSFVEAQMGFAPYLGVLLRVHLANDLETSEAGIDSSLAATTVHSGEPEIGLDYVHAAQIAGAASLAEADRSRLAYQNDILTLLALDVRENRLDTEGAKRWRAMTDDTAVYEASIRVYPRSRAMRFSIATRHLAARRFDDARRVIDEVAADSPTLALFDLVRIEASSGAGALEQARALLARARSAFRDDVRLVDSLVPATAPASVAPVPLPADFASQLSLQSALASVPATTLRALGGVRRADVAHAVEVWVPSAAARVPGGSSVGFSLASGLQLHVARFPRDSRCIGEQCLDRILPDYEGRGLVPAWTGTLTLGERELAVAVLPGPLGAIVTATYPIGASVYSLTVFGATPALAESLPALRLFLESFGATDVSVSAMLAEALRADVAGAGVVDAHRLDARRVTRASRSVSCPLTTLLAGQPSDDARGLLLLDTFLAMTNVDEKRRVLACTSPGAAPAARLAAIATLDGEPSIHAFGTGAARANPTRMLADTRIVLATATLPALAGRDPEGRLLPPFAATELIVALPAVERRSLTRELFARDDARDRTLAYVIESAQPGTIDPSALVERIRAGAANDTRTLATRLSTRDVPGLLGAVRARLDTLAGATDEESSELRIGLADMLADELDQADAARLHELSRTATAPFAERYGRIVAFYDRGLALRRGDVLPDDDLTRRVRSAIADQAERAPRRGIAARLARAPLADLLPGDGWDVVRVEQPGLFVGTMQSLFRRLDGRTASDASTAREALADTSDHHGASLLTPSGGLDLTRPIECARWIDGWGWVCSAYVADADAVRRVLATRGYGTDSAVAMPLDAIRRALGVPLAFSALPLTMHGQLFDAGGPSLSTPLLVEERVRTSATIAGVALERFMTFRALRDRSPGVDIELYRFEGDRLTVFSTDQVARAVLASAPGEQMLGSMRAYRDAISGWRGGTGAQVYVQPESLPLGATAAAVQVVPTNTSLELRYRSTARTAALDVAALEARLPPGAAARVALARGIGREDRELELEAIATLGRTPPLWLANVAPALAFAWYPEARGEMWSRWVAVVRNDAEVERAWSAHGLSAAPAVGQARVADGLFAARDGDVLMIGPDATLVAAARASASVAPTTGLRRVAGGQLDSALASAALLALAQSHGSRGPNFALRSLVSFGGVTDGMSLDARLDPRTRALDVVAHLGLRLTPEGTDTTLVDAALSTAPDRNAVRLPRALDAAAMARPVTFVIETDDARTLAARAFQPSSRQTVEVIDERHLRVRSSPSPAPGFPASATPLTTDERAALLADDGLIIVGAPAVRRIITEIAPRRGSPEEIAGAVVAWVHSHVRYELTPTGVDAVGVIERGRGDCTEYAILAVSLLRAAGIPAEVRSGFAADGREAVGHAWAAYHDGTGWRELDPTAGVLIADAGHVQVSLSELLALSHANHFRVVAIEADPR